MSINLNNDTEAAPLLHEKQTAPKDKRWMYVVALFVLIVAIVIIVQVTSTCEDGFEWWGEWYCPGDCVIQADEEYCPMPDERPMLLYEVDVNENAKCMDGTTSNIHFRESLPGDHENHWILRFEGGALCFDEFSCGTRYEYNYDYATASQTPIIYQDSPEGGILSGDPAMNPLFHDYNALHPHYCSSDTWIGNSTLDENGLYWFMGYHNMIASLEMAEAHWNLTAADKILIMGMSAGGQGLSSAAEHLQAWLDEHVPDAEVFYVIDSGWFLASYESFGFSNVTYDTPLEFDCDSWDNCPLMNMSTSQCDLQKSVVPQSCLDRGFSCPECMFPEYNMPTATTRNQTLIVENLFDHQQIEVHTQREYDLTDEEEAGIAAAVLASIEEKAYSYVAPNCDNHDYINRVFMFNVEMDGWTIADYINDFVENAPLQYNEADPVLDENNSSSRLSNPSCPDMNGDYNNPHID